MRDLIDRQKAIEAMSHVNDSICGQQAIDELLELPSENQWIPVTKRLPDTYTAVLVSDGKYVWVDSLEDDFDGNGEYVVWWDSSNLVDFDKTAWMPLPEPYK